VTITAVIFDVGGVLAHPGATEFPQVFFGSRDADSDHPWHRLERGEITMAQALPLLGVPPGPPAPPRPYTLDEGYLEVAEQLAEAGFKLALCTNTPRESAPLWQALYPWAEVFEVIVRSCDVGVRKPNPRLVHAALERLGSAPGETVFVDDLPANRSSARTLGVTTIAGGGPDGIARLRELTGVGAGAARRIVGPRGPRRPPVRNRGDRLLADVLFEPAHNADPYPLLHQLREISPMHQLADNPIWYATRYADCREVLRDSEFLKVTEYQALDFATAEPVPPPPAGTVLPLAFIDPPDHTRIRKVMNAGFTRRRVDELRPWLRGLAGEVVEKALSPEPVDIVEAISYPLAMHVICDLVGVPTGARDAFRSLMRDAAVLFEPALPPDRTYDAVVAIRAMTEFFTELGSAATGLLRDLLAEARQADEVSAADVIANITFMFFAGFETVAHLISTTLYLMSTHPDQYALIAAQPELADQAAQEVSRYHSPVQTSSRIASVDTEIGGTPLPAGTVVVTMLGAANRDPAAYPDPDRFDIVRGGPPALAFGAGIHYCLGARLAQLEAAVILESLVAAGVRSITLGRAEWKHAIVLRGFDLLELSFTRGG
jgi:HAD superfamily hydrolase (TIGR01509 family)